MIRGSLGPPPGLTHLTTVADLAVVGESPEATFILPPSTFGPPRAPLPPAFPEHVPCYCGAQPAADAALFEIRIQTASRVQV